MTAPLLATALDALEGVYIVTTYDELDAAFKNRSGIQAFSGQGDELVIVERLHDPYTRAAICDVCGKVTAWKKVNNKFVCRHEERK